MKAPKVWASILAHEIIEELYKKKLVELKAPKDKVTAVTEQLIFNELMIEDKINTEVRELLKKYDMEIEKGRLDYRRLFDITKQKLVKERNIIL
jgi:hypothetical protein